MFIHITVNQSRGRPIISRLLICFSFHCTMIYYSLTSLKITQEFHLLLGFVENQTVFWDFKIRNSVQITESSDNGDSDNRGPTVCIYIYIYIYICKS